MKRCVSLAVLTATIGLLGLIPAAQAELRVEPNQQLDSDSNPFRGRDQVGLAVNPSNPQHVVEVNANYLDLECESSVSFDGGETWSAATPLAPPAPVGLEDPFAPSCFTFQSVEFGSGQNVYATATYNRTTSSIPDASTLTFKSTNGGATWQPGVVAMEGGPGSATNPPPGPSYSRPSLSVDPGAGTGGADIVYVAARDFRGTVNGGDPVIRVAISKDGGQTYTATNASPAGVSVTDQPSKPVVNPDGSITVVWRTTGTIGLLQASRSTDQGATWSAPVDIAEVVNTGTSTLTHIAPQDETPPRPVGTGASTSASYPRMAGDPTSGNLYLVYSQGIGGPNPPAGGYQGADHFISPDSAVYLQRSTDRGLTWGAPKLINDTTKYPGATTVQTRHPSVSVAPGGRVDIVWHDRRHWFQGPGERNCSHSHIYCEDIRLGDTYYAYSTNGGATFSENIRINDRSRNSGVGYDTRPSAHWNYGPQAVAVGTGKLLVGWMDSREGNWDTDTEDIYVATVDHNATGAAPSTNIDQPDAISRAVALSQRAYQGGNEGAMIGGPRDPAGAGSNGPATRNASSVVIVNQADVGGAMAGTVLARARPSSVLLSAAGGLPAIVKAEVGRLRPDGAYIIGNTASLSAQVQTDLVAAGIAPANITRLAGVNDADTAAKIAAEIHTRSPAETANPSFDAAVIANPASPDAAAAVGLAAARRLPILYVNASGPVPAQTQSAIVTLGITKTLVIGGTGVIGSDVAAALPSPTRLGGADQYATSEAVVDEAIARGMPANIVYVADGAKPMDGALLAGIVARATGMLVLAPAALGTTAAGQAATFGLNDIDQIVTLATSLVAPPPPPPPVAPPPPAPVPPAPVPPPPPVPAPQEEVFPAKLRVERVRSRGRTLSLLIRLTGRADGQLEFEYFSAGQKVRFKRTIRNGTVSTTLRLSVKQARLGTGIVTVSYEGNKRVRKDEVRVRAARNPALLKRKTARILNGRLQVSGTLSKRVRRGVVRIRLGYEAPDGTVKFLNYRAPIKRGIKTATWKISQQLPADAAKSGGQLSIQYTGEQLGRIGGQATAKQVRP